jgi:pyruvate dehydrogenase E2 component (dihydrolipoamide acetyltransferase)
MGLSLTIDHRAVDGAPAAAFLSDLCQTIDSLA